MSTEAVAHVVPTLEARALSGDRAAEREVCLRLIPAMRAFARRRLARAAAEDFVQDAVVLLVEAMRSRRVESPDRLAGFALGICKNLARERARNGERRAELLATYGFGDTFVAPRAPEFRRDHLEDCYSQLTSRARDVIRTTFCDDEDDASIADALGLTVANVRVIRHRTLAALRTCLEGPISWATR